MTKVYLKYGEEIKLIDNAAAKNLVDKYITKFREGVRLRVIVNEDNYESPKIQLAEYIFEYEEPWKSDYWLLESSIWEGVFIPDESWELFEIK